MGIRDVPTAPQSPWQNPFAERLTSRFRKMHRMGGQSSGRRWARSYRFPKSAVYIIATSAGPHNSASTGPRPATNVLSRQLFVVSAVIRPCADNHIVLCRAIAEACRLPYGAGHPLACRQAC
jgi:hypothetical protein